MTAIKQRAASDSYHEASGTGGNEVPQPRFMGGDADATVQGLMARTQSRIFDRWKGARASCP